MPLTLQDLAKKIADIDFTLLTTKTEDGKLAARPMSNNGDVEYDGDSFFFSDEEARTVSDIERDPKVGLTLQGDKGLLGKPGIFVTVEGEGEIIRDKAQFEKHWVPDLERWWPNGIETPGIVLIKVHANRIHYWDGEAEGEIKLQ